MPEQQQPAGQGDTPPPDAATAPDLPPQQPDEAPDPSVAQVRILPADWSVDALTFTLQDAKKRDYQVTVTQDRPGNVPFLIAESDADGFVASAAELGVAVKRADKEISA